ncbi:MAG: MerR family DNA-binding protein [Planctomycetes bacterium]|nr:MerR family DNA-binding protein [Planctomycetota bacterium]
MNGEGAINRLRFIRATQENGFSLKDVLALLNFRDGKTSRCRVVQELIKARLTDLEKRAEELRLVQALLHSSPKACREFERIGRCRVIESLDFASTSPPGKKVRP